MGATASFLGARVGAKANREVSTEATAQRDAQARRDEWGRRFAFALERTGSPQILQRRIALTMLETLVNSSLASDDDRTLAREVYLIFARTSLSVVRERLDDADVVVDDEESDEGGELT